jgi:hypothetical protein
MRPIMTIIGVKKTVANTASPTQLAFAMKRDCSDESMFGYFLYPFFGGSEVAPQDMTVSVWTREKANFAMEKSGPNPLKAGEKLRVQLRVGEPMEIEFQIYNLIGQLVYKTYSIAFDENPELQLYELNVPFDLSSGIYFIRPAAVMREIRINWFL